MKIVWTVLFLTTVRTHRVVDSSEGSSPSANITTTLYPVTGTNTTSAEEKKLKTEATVWKIDTAFSMSNSGEQNSTSNEAKPVTVTVNVSEEFRPSQHLGDFFEVEGLETPPTLEPSTDGKTETPKLFSPTNNHSPYKHSFLKTDFPYKLESPILSRPANSWKTTTASWKPSSLEAQPTVDTPVRVPAGGLYKLPANKHQPSDGDFGWDFFHKDEDVVIKKRPEPWKRLLQWATALLPVGLIVSALTPGVVTVHDAGNYHHNLNQLYTRRSSLPPHLPGMSERCRRRLLCELHADYNYAPPAPPRDYPPRRRKRCYKLPCEDIAGLEVTLHWLLNYRPPHNTNVEPFT